MNENDALPSWVNYMFATICLFIIAFVLTKYIEYNENIEQIQLEAKQLCIDQKFKDNKIEDVYIQKMSYNIFTKKINWIECIILTPNEKLIQNKNWDGVWD